MENTIRERSAGIILIGAVACTFIGTSDVHAGPAFPPSPHSQDAVFVEVDEGSNTTISVPWYRPRTPAANAATDTPTAAPRFVFVERGPWYRSAN